MSAYDSSTAQLPSEGQLSWAMYGAEDTMRAFSTVGLLSCGFFKIQRQTEATPRYETNTAIRVPGTQTEVGDRSACQRM